MADAAGAEQLLTELKKDADTFRGFAQLDEDTPQGLFYSRVVETMELAATSPLLMWLLSRNHAVPTDQVSVALGALESWVMRRTLLRYTMKEVNKLMVAILKELDTASPQAAGAVVATFLVRQTADAQLWPTDQDLRENLPRTRLYGNVRQGRLRVVLEAIEQRMRTEKNGQVSLPKALEIEHVMPQGWRSHWDSDPKQTPEQAAARDRRVNALGNLTLVTKKLNGSLSHRPWTDLGAQEFGAGADKGKGKCGLLDKHSLLMLNKELINDHPVAWTDEDIHRRSRELTAQIAQIWPRPAFPPGDAVADETSQA